MAVASEDEDGAEWEVIHEGGDRKEDAISLLDKLVHGRAPFDHQPPPSRSKYPEELRQRWPRATVQPILELLNKWTDNKEKVVVQSGDVWLAVIKGDNLRLFDEVIKPGLFFEGGWLLSGRIHNYTCLTINFATNVC